MEAEAGHDTAIPVAETPAKPLRYKERVAATLADWQQRWPAIFTTPVPLAIGISRQLREQLELPRDEIGIAIHQWTKRSGYIRSIAQGVMRRNLDGSEAGLPTDDARQQARDFLIARARQQKARDAEKAARDAARSAAQTAETHDQAAV